MTARARLGVLLCAFGVFAAAQMADMRIMSKQVAVQPRALIGGSNLTEFAASLHEFNTNIPPGYLSRPGASVMTQDVLATGMSNAIVTGIESGVGLRFSVTSFYNYVEGSTVSVYNASIPANASTTTGVVAADRAYVSGADFVRSQIATADIEMLGAIGAVTTRTFTATGTTRLGGLTAGTVTVARVDTPILSGRNEVSTYYRELGRATVSRSSSTMLTNSWSTVPRRNISAGTVSTNVFQVASGSYDSVVTNVLVVPQDYWVTNTPFVVYAADGVGVFTNAAWESVYIGDPGGASITNWIPMTRVGASPPYTFSPTNHVYQNGDPPVWFTNSFYSVEHVTNDILTITNVMAVPVYTYTNATLVTTNASAQYTPDTGPVGVCTTNFVTRTFAPGVLHTNASGRLYIHEPTAIQPAGSGTSVDPFIMAVPENFRWVRENHKPAGRMATVRNDSGDGFANDGGSSHLTATQFGPAYETPGEYMATVDLTNGVMRAAVTYCIQTNDIDMLDTYLWVYNQWPNGEFVEGFVGISGAPTTGINKRTETSLPANIIVDNNVAGATNLLRSTYSTSMGVLNSRYALSTWPNRRYAHHLNYDGRGHSLSGVWVGVNPEATGTARGLLGCAVTAPTVRNLRISGHVEYAATVVTNSVSSYSYIAMGGLFGWVGSGINGVGAATRFAYTNPINYLGRYSVFTNAIARDVSTCISNCVVFADMDASYSGERDKIGYPWLVCTTIAQGGLFGVISIPYRDYWSIYVMNDLVIDFQTAIRPTQLIDNSVVGRRSIYSSHHGGSFHSGRIVGRVANPRLVYGTLGTTRMFIPCSYGDPSELRRNLFLDNTKVYLGPGGPQRAASDSYVFDGLDSYKYAAAITVPSASARASARIKVPALTEDAFARARLVASELGYYGNLDFVNESFQYNAENGNGAAVALIGRYGDYKDENSDGGYSPMFTASAAYPGVTAYTALAAKDAVRVVYPASVGTYPDFALLSIDGSGYHIGYAGTYYGVYSNNSAVVVNAAALRDEVYGPVAEAPSRAAWPAGRFDRTSTPNLFVRSSEEMTRAYVTEPANDIGGGGITHDIAYPYSKFSADKWTLPGELDSWYPVPVGVAGLTLSNSAEQVVSTWRPVGAADFGGVRVLSATNDTTVTSSRYVELAFTNRYAVAATQTSPTSCVLTVLTQVYRRGSVRQTAETFHTEVVSTNAFQSYTGAVSVASGFVAAGPVSVSGTVYRVDDSGYSVDSRGGEYGTFRVSGTNVTPAVISAYLACTNSTLSFSGNALPIHFEWWPDSISQTGLVVSLLRGGETNVLGQFNYCDSLPGDVFNLFSPVSGYAIVKQGSPTDGLTLVDPLVFRAPDVGFLRTSGTEGAVFQVSFGASSAGPPYMSPLAPSLWSGTYRGAASSSGITEGGAVYFDGTNYPYAATLRVDMINSAGAGLDDAEFFRSVQVFCNYAKPEYLIPGTPAPRTLVRQSPTSGYIEYPVRVRQLVTLHALGDFGTAATVTLLPEEDVP